MPTNPKSTKFASVIGRMFLSFAQVGFAFNRIEGALSLLVQNLSDLSGLAAKTERIDTLFTGVTSSRSRTCPEWHRRLPSLTCL